MREMKDSGVPWIGDIPVDWNVSIVLSEFEEVKNINKGMLEKNLLSLSYGNIVRKEINSNNGLLPDSFETYNIIPQNSIVLRLTDLQNDKRSLRSAICNEQGIITSAYTTIQLKSDIENHPRYMNYLFRCYDDCKVFYGLGNGVRQSINYSELKRVAILKPSYNCQMQIAKYLDTKCTQIDTIIAREQSVIEKLQEYNRAIISEAITKGINSDRAVIDSGVQWIGRIPNSWKIIKLKYEADIRRGRFSHRPRNDPDYYDGKYPFIQTGDITASKKYITSYTQTLNERGLKVSTSFPKDTICMSIAANIGDVAILSFDACFPDSIVGIGPKNIEINYLYYALKNMKERLLSVATISTQQNINVEILNDEFIALPPVDEQKQISNYLDRKSEAIDRIVYQKKYLIDKLNEYKKSLIYEVVTGKKEVPHV